MPEEPLYMKTTLREPFPFCQARLQFRLVCAASRSEACTVGSLDGGGVVLVVRVLGLLVAVLVLYSIVPVPPLYSHTIT